MALHSWDRSMAEMSPCIKERSIITLGIIQQHWTPSDIERCLTTLESSKTRTNKSHGSLRRTSSASKPLSTHLTNKTIITDLILGIANAGLQTIRSLKTSTSRARKCCCCFATRMKMCVEALGSFDISLKRRHKKALAESLTEMKRKSIKDAKTEDRRVDAIRWQYIDIQVPKQ